MTVQNVDVELIYFPIAWVAVLFGFAELPTITGLLAAYDVIILILWNQSNIPTLHISNARELRKG